MVKLGFIALNGEKENWYHKLQFYSDIETSLQEEFTEKDKCDAYFILGGASQLADICNTYMKIVESNSCPVWIYKEKSNGNDRLLLYNIGAISVFNETMHQGEIVKAIHNGLVLIQETLEKNKKETIKKKNENKFKLINENLCVVLDNKTTIYLTQKEFKTLSLLYSCSPKAVSYKELFEQVWELPYDKQNYRIANIIFHLRLKLEKDVSSPQIVKTVRSNGYLFNNNYK
ncbi:winged helix-turn-helix domain-containing protein [Enterococcus sp. AZ126]|uniref:winged helix-turn-helix domain-containing protein n=1 Tax=Enterococcus sp. AZ126 TaxID=2774635 RepID=UPI003F26B2E9